MTLSREINTSEADGEYIKDLLAVFEKNYNYVGNSNLLIAYPDKAFKEQGIPAPWQTIAWRKIISKLGEDNFRRLPFELNYLGNDNVLFKSKFSEHFGSCPNPEKLEVTFFCGYFWRFNENRREKMLNFFVNSLLKKGTKVEIWTQDKTLKEAFSEKLKDSPESRNLLCVQTVEKRLDMHFTLIKDNDQLENSLILLELPHTEAHYFRLETYLTFGELKKFNCDPDEFTEVLYSYKKQTFLRNLLFRFNLALNTERNKQ